MSRGALLGPGTVSWKVNREGTLLAGGGRALLLQVAHPLVAAGVAQHSNYQAEPWQRLYRTMDTMLKIAFGDRQTSEGAAKRLSRRHGPVKGTAPDGRPYNAMDPALLIWVWATLVDSSVLVHGLLFEPLSEADRERFLAEQQLLAHACGVPEGAGPNSWTEFRDYFDRVVAQELEVTEAARAVADSISDPKMLPRPFGDPAVKISRALTAGLLPESVREAYGYSWDAAERRRFRRTIAAGRAGVRITPGPLRRLPATILSRPPRRQKPASAPAGVPGAAA
ncbi:MAG: oxygenase MpaB family protein [Solirubrobacterales bacterium]